MIQWEPIATSIGNATRTRFELDDAIPLAGGCINQAWSIKARDGQRYFVKLNNASKLPMFDAERAGLSAIAATRTIRVPQPVAHGTSGEHAFLVLEYLELKSSGNARLLGEQLAALHRCTSPPLPCRERAGVRVDTSPSHTSTPILPFPLQGGRNDGGTQSLFGFPLNNTLGETPQRNTWSADWITFWREQRLGFQLELAARNGYDGELQKMGGQLMEKLPEYFAGHHPVPSLLHGDLWGGNHAYTADGMPVMFDPAPYYGDREADLAMTELFGGYEAEFYSAYRAAWPLDEGYAMRKILYNLYHILNHANLFGGGYARQAEEMMRRLLSSVP